MKKGLFVSGLLLFLFSFPAAMAQDDVYDAPKVKAKKTPKVSTNLPANEQSVPYYDEENSAGKRTNLPGNNNNNGNYGYEQQQDQQRYGDNYYADDFAFNSGFGYTDRIRRFHNPSIRFHVGWDYYNSFYSSWYNNFDYGWYNNYFTPSWVYNYSNFYNPFWNNSTIVVIQQPWYNSWYSAGFNNPWWGWNRWDNWGYNWFSPHCSNIIYNNNYPYYNNYYDYNRKNVVSAPRVGYHTNTPYVPVKSNNNNGNNNNGYNNNGYNNNTNQPNKTYNNKQWNNNNQPRTNPNDVYKYNNQPKNNNTTPNYQKNNNNNAPANNGGWNKGNSAPSNNNSGIKIGTKPK